MHRPAHCVLRKVEISNHGILEIIVTNGAKFTNILFIDLENIKNVRLLLRLQSFERETMLQILVLAMLFAVPPVNHSADIFAPIKIYEGSWLATPGISGKADSISNACYSYTKYFACQQTVNGEVGALVVYVAADDPGLNKSQVILPSGRAIGLGDLVIQGNHWVYSNRNVENGKTT